ncbi:MAG: ATP-dependent RecD-like DNA helicase [Ruminococcaceae bacterium]|nr:ATP-dependent RecD-like DNA helicase [Oscillospiraceae bacterium]
MGEVMPYMTEHPDDAGIIRIGGSIEHVIYSNEENGYSICDMGTDDDELITIVGTMPFIAEGEEVVVYGKWIHNPKYGRQFAVQNYEKILPADVNSILRYLSSGSIKGIGPKTALRIVEAYGAESFDVIEHHPDWLAEVKGISRKSAEKISEEFRAQSGMRSAMLFFRDFFGPATTMRIYKKWGGGAVDIAKHNPYRLCDEIDGVGFERADAMAERLGLARDSAARINSGIRYLLTVNGIQNGHVCLPREKLADSAAALLGVSREQADGAISDLLKYDLLKYTRIEGVQFIYPEDAYNDEKYIAEKLVLLERTCAGLSHADIERFILREEQEGGISYAAQQKQAIYDALRSGVMLLTGGPGTGKTTVVRALLDIFESMGYKVALAAPTGRAAMRMSAACAREAKTIHRLLEMEYSENERMHFSRDESNLLGENVIIIDEASMIDNALLAALLRAVKPGAHFILIGDADQLPSVGAGRVLWDLIGSGRFATVRLTEIFRQAQSSLIITNAHRINSGEMPVLTVKDNDFFFLPRGGEREIAATVADLWLNRLPRSYGEETRDRIQVISPSRKGGAGTESLNIVLQQALNPPDLQKREYKFRDITFREGDRVMQIRNNYDLEWETEHKQGQGIFNGDIGVIKTIDSHDRMMEISFDDKLVRYDFSNLEDLEHAYAITVHKSQGSEYPIVILPAYNCAQMLLTRNLLYTAVTRAQSMVIVVGSADILRTMVENNRQSMRYTGLAFRLARGENE